MENTKQITAKNCIKYLIFAGVIYSVLKIVPTQKLSNMEMTVLIVIILLGIFSLDCLTVSKSQKEGMSNAKKLFDLDLDVDLDFNKASSDIKETNTDVKSTESNESVVSEKGINLSDVQKELNKKIQEEKSDTESDKSETPIKIKDDTQEKKSSTNKKSTEAEKKDELKEKKAEEKEKKAEEKEKKAEAKEKKVEAKEKKAEAIQEKKQEKIQKIKDEIKVKKAKIEEKESKGVNCEVEVAKMKQHLEETIKKLREELRSKTDSTNKSKFGKKYLNVLIADLLHKRIIEKIDVENINAKLISGASTLDEVIQSLEKLKSIGVPKKVSSPKDRSNDMKYSDLPPRSYQPIGKNIANEWTNEYTILNTDKWQVQQPRPPVCVSSGPCKVCPTNTDGYPVSLGEWDDSRVISNTKINKKWALDQADSS